MYKRIKNLREDMDYTQEYVSKYLKINRVVYSRYENGIREVPVDIIKKLSKLYNVSTDYILENINIKNYDIFLKEIKEIENNQRCKKCGEKKLIHTNPFDYEFICRNCGETNKIRTNNYSKN